MPSEKQPKSQLEELGKRKMLTGSSISHSLKESLRLADENTINVDGSSTLYVRFKPTDTDDGFDSQSSSILGSEVELACKSLLEAIELRKKYFKENDVHQNSQFFSRSELEIPLNIKIIDGVFIPFSKDKEAYAKPISFHDYILDYNRLLFIASSGPVRTFTYKRLKYLEYKFELHKMMNRDREILAAKFDPKDFSNVFKVDTHVHLAAAMTAGHLLDFIKRKAHNFPKDEVVLNRDGSKQSLEAVFEAAKLKPTDLTVNSLDVYADNTFQRFDNFNSKYNPFGFSELRTVFLKTDNYNKGRYFGELTQELLDGLERSKYNKAEYRLSIYGRSPNEWNDLALWVENNNLDPDCNQNKWIIQIPRIYEVFRKVNAIKNFQDMIENIFKPIFEVTLNPESNPVLFKFLSKVSAFDSVDDESKPETKLRKETMPATPDLWDSLENPPYAYYMYYLWANIQSLNELRKLYGLSLFDFRPHSGESGDVDHLAASYLVARGVNHGINLERNTSLQYLFYLSQIGLAVSPLSNNALFLDYKRNPFPLFFKRGLNVSLSTDDPLQFHLTQDPLLEEYAIAGKRWKFSDCDLAEIARNSVLQSGFSHLQKQNWIGPNYHLKGVDGNDVSYTNIPNIRVSYREETLQYEFDELKKYTAGKSSISPCLIQVDYPKQVPTVQIEDVEACQLIQEAMKMRQKYVMDHSCVLAADTSDQNQSIRCIDGVYQVFRGANSICSNCEESFAIFECGNCCKRYCHSCDHTLHKNPSKRDHFRSSCEVNKAMFSPVSWEEFVVDLLRLEAIRLDGRAHTFSKTRLAVLELRYDLHCLLNDFFEKEGLKKSETDFERIIKVDTHVHALSAPCAGHLLDFMKHKITEHPEDMVLYEEGQHLTLEQVFNRLNIPFDNFTLDTLEMKAVNTFNRFDKFTSTYNPLGRSELRTIFLKKDNYLKGKYFAQLLGQVLKKSEERKCIKMELRISIYGRTVSEWDHLADWILENPELQSKSNKWIVQVPRLYHVFKENGDVENFQQFLDHVFKPLFEVTENPESHPNLHILLRDFITGFDSVDEEVTGDDLTPHSAFISPLEWNGDSNPPFNFYMYYMYANIHSLNRFRASKGLSTFSFRPHCGAGGGRSHLSGAFLLTDGITHGIVLDKVPTMQYLFFLSQLPISMSPLGEDAIYMNYDQNPFGKFFKRGLNVSLSTDAPLQLHSTNEPLIEEYSSAAKMWKLSICDLCELSRNSVLQSSFSKKEKEEWLGPSDKNDVNFSNVPDTRITFRHHSRHHEAHMVERVVHLKKRRQIREMAPTSPPPVSRTQQEVWKKNQEDEEDVKNALNRRGDAVEHHHPEHHHKIVFNGSTVVLLTVGLLFLPQIGSLAVNYLKKRFFN
eukprot:TRINITY_DN7238_c0_g1_i1.p1 TRINITY_DN7238_c0_g1~~TRINITY_DN7238_c0_g1_i1.p1  ORF type:complete len:1372 (+),score=486.98 TRINITY_DN7238_c0_g1_i1:123-4238(+)